VEDHDPDRHGLDYNERPDWHGVGSRVQTIVPKTTPVASARLSTAGAKIRFDVFTNKM
jgi:hypothetical protein